MAIILILTLTIDAFVPEDNSLRNLKVAGDYSAVFPLLTVAVFVALHISRQMIFYEKQRSRGDIQALPEALCEPGKEGKPLVMDYDGKLHALDESDYEYETDSGDDSDTFNIDDNITSIREDDIEANPPPTLKTYESILKDNSKGELPGHSSAEALNLDDSTSNNILVEKLMAKKSESSKIANKEKYKESRRKKKNRLETLDRFLNGPIISPAVNELSSSNSEKKMRTHRRTQSEPFVLDDVNHRIDVMFNSSSPNIWKKPVLKRVDSYGEIDQGQPSLMDQARRRAASIAKVDGSTKTKS